MSGSARGEHGSDIERVVELARQRRPDDPLAIEFVAEYYRELPEFDVDDRRTDDLYAAAVTHLALGRRRLVGETHLRLINPDRDRDGWHSERSVVLLVTDDVPFLVDTLRLVLEDHDVATHLMVHPMLSVVRSDDGELVDVHTLGETEPADALVEAWTMLEIDRADDASGAELEADLRAAVASVHAAVACFEPMQTRMRLHTDVDPVLDWLASANFVFLAAATFRRSDASGGDLVEGSVLGDRALATALDPPIDWDGPVVSFARSDRVSPVHRAARLYVVTILSTDAESGAEVADRFVGLLASTAYRQSALGIPTVGDRARGVLGLAHAGAETHTGRSMRNVLETLPRELLFELDSRSLAQLVIDVVGLQERQIVRVFDVPEPSGRWSTVLVYFPKRRYDAELPGRIADLIARAYESEVRDVESHLGNSNLARVTCTVRTNGVVPDLDQLSAVVDRATTAWIELVHDAAAEELGEADATALVHRIGEASTEAYRSAVNPDMAIGDLRRLADLLDSDETTMSALVHDVDAEADHWRVRLYRQGNPIVLSDLMPTLGNLGLVALEEHPYEFRIGDECCHVYDIGVRLPAGTAIDELRHRELRSAFEGLLAGEIESDGFNRLVLLAGLTSFQINVLRVYSKYAHQIGFTLSQGYIESALARLPALARALVELFEARFDPDVDDADRIAAVSAAEADVLELLDGVPSLDDDRVGRVLFKLIRATVRTSAYAGKPTVAIKFDPARVPDLPEPRPAHEIFVCSARVEGVHLRGGPIARGGLRWSDRSEDYRTEVLGLVKAQMVKNAVIVPVGAKGGFVVKRPPADRAAQRAEGEACYRLFVSGLLDVTDNIVGDDVVRPERVRCYDGPDPYLVVAADKGTATFSDIANGIAADYGFWLGDAFASGGSAGYDHKAMGITARGAWESVRRHAAVLGFDADNHEMTVVGIGDMSGDVFGNGLLRSAHLKLVAAFDHRDVFIDPDPDPAVSFTERRRLFELAGSSWQDYDRSLISEGGGVYSRQAKSITLSAEAQARLGVDRESFTPAELISAILRAPVDLLWNGGVGTYVKASTESHGDAGDRSNDSVRVNGDELRCRMVGEGGNLGFTQLARVEYALHGGLIYTDAIDNSAGVDCSDHEVNIKILLGDVMAGGELTLPQRNVLLEQMTDEVAELVLANNQAQTLALVIARTQGLPMVNVHARYLDQLELEGWIDRDLEFLPTDKQLAERQASGSGLRAPELAVLIAYTKNANVAEIMGTDLPDDPALNEDLFEYFPQPLRERYPVQIRRHRLRREIAATQLVNQMVNLSGISYDHRMTEDTGASVTDVARGWLAAREVLDFPAWWREIDAIRDIRLEDRLEMYLDCRRTAERCSLWFLRNRRPPVDIAAEVARFREPVTNLAAEYPYRLVGPLHDAAQALAAERVDQGVPAALASRSSVWRLLHTALDVVELAGRHGIDPLFVASVYWQLFDRFELLWLWDGIGALPRGDRWQTQARSAQRDDLLAVLSGLTDNVLEDGSVDAWMSANERSVGRTMQQLTAIRRIEHLNITQLSVAVRQLRNLVQTSVRGA